MKTPWIITGLLVAVAALSGCRSGGSAAPATCSQAAGYPAELNALPVAELERRLLSMRVLPPSAAKQQLTQTRLAADRQPEAQRACAYQSELVRLIVLGRHVGEVGETWGQLKEVDELKQLMLEAPFTIPTTPEQRQRLVEQVETQRVPHASMGPDDGDYWRRMYLGVVLLCQVTPEELKVLHARRPMQCPASH